MNTIKVNASRSYSVVVGNGLLEQLVTYLTGIKKNPKIAIISDDNVWPIYGNKVIEHIHDAGFKVFHFVFPAGEASKNAETYISIVNFLAENHILRSDLLIALGGGVVGDITGFAAATYLRGISYIQVPTTLLAMVDSSVGGKTAIDLQVGKNLVGAFYQPSLVLCDMNTLETLPKDIFIDGCAEVIKYGVLYDEALFEHLLVKGLSFDREYVISRCISLKRDVVAQDEFDTGLRQKLNLGHTIGHGVEAQSDFTISHGKAVSIGMAIVTKAAAAEHFCDSQVYESVQKILHKFTLPTATTYTAEELFTSALSDKKRSGSVVNLILPKEIGNCVIHPLPIEKLENFIKAGL